VLAVDHKQLRKNGAERKQPKELPEELFTVKQLTTQELVRIQGALTPTLLHRMVHRILRVECWMA